MSDYNKLTYNELFQINDELRYTIANLKKQLEEYEKYTARVYAPGKSYKDFEKKVDQLTAENLSLAKTIEYLENKLEESNTEKKKEIETLVQDSVELQKELKETKDKYYKLQEDNLYLKKTNKDQEAIIHLAAGYISSTPQFSKEHQ